MRRKKMKIKHWDLHLTWEDGTVNEVSSYVPMSVVRAMEDFIDYWEEKHSDAHEDEEDDEEDEEDE
jgi:hypothetical protein